MQYKLHELAALVSAHRWHNRDAVWGVPVMSKQRQFIPVALLALMPIVLTGCGGGGGGGGAAPPSGSTTYTIGGTVNGLTGTGLVLRNNGGDDLVIASDGVFTFATPVANGGAYAVTAFTQPRPVSPSDPTQSCSVSNGSGVVAGANIDDVLVTCANAYTTLQIEVGSYSSCALLNYNQLKCWGWNAYGQLAQGDTVDRGDDAGEMGNALMQIDVRAPRTVVQMETGGEHACAVLDNGRVRCWGRNDRGQLGLGDVDNRGDAPGEMGDNLSTVDLGSGRSALQVAVGNQHSCALLDNGGVKCWGRNDFGQLGQGHNFDKGDGPNELGDFLSEIALDASYGTVTQIAAGGFHTCALFDSGNVQCWGVNDQGQLGLGDTESRGDEVNEMGTNLPAVNLGTGRTAVQISAGLYHTCALLDNDRVKCWGRNLEGQLGLGDTDNRGDAANEMGDALPVIALGQGLLGQPLSTSQVSAGGWHTCALLNTNLVKCWGTNSAGELGIGDTLRRGDDAGEMGNALPVIDLGTGRTAVQVSAGSAHSCARLDNGDVKCWGDALFGQIGLIDEIGSNADNYRGDQPEDMGDNLPAIDLGAPVL